MADISSLGKNIKYFREGKGWRQEELAQKLGVTDKAVSAWENGRAYPRMAPLNKMCELFNCKLSELTTDYDAVPMGYLSRYLDQEIQIDIKKSAPPQQAETRLLKIFRILSSEQQRKVIDFAIDMMEDENGSKV